MEATTASIATAPAPEGREFCPPPHRDESLYGARAHQNKTKCYQLSRDFFQDGVKRAKEQNMRQSDLEKRLLATTATALQEQLWVNAGKLEGKYLRFLRTPNRIDDYDVIKTIGKGAFGEVKLVRRKQDSRVYALKSQLKTQMIAQLQLARVRAERDILAEAESPWVVKLCTTFQDARFLYMLMEFLPGGDLMTMLIKYEIFSEDITRFYMAEMIMAIEAVHHLGFIHRDIKPDNILLDRGGHVKLTDFGLSTGFRQLHENNYYQQLLQGPGPSNLSRPGQRESVNIDQISLTVSNRAQINEWRRSRRMMAYSAVGTPDYIAPEMFTGQGYSYDLDWWSLGTIMYECLVGWPPFCAEDRRDTYRKIMNWRQCLYFPDDIRLSHDAENLIRSLVCNTEVRLGRGGAQEIKAHPYFAGVDFASLRRIRAPFEPHLTSDIDTAYFPTDDLERVSVEAVVTAQAQAQAQVAEGSRQPDQTPQAEPVDTPEMTLPFVGYTFKRFENSFH